LKFLKAQNFLSGFVTLLKFGES